MLSLPYFSESGIEIFYGTAGSAGLDLPLWDARITHKYVEAAIAGATEEELDSLEAKLVQDKEYMETQSVTLQPMGQLTIKTGIYVGIPEGYYGSLDTRSSTSKIRQDLLCHTIDEDFRGNMRLAVINLHEIPVTLKMGQSIAQLIIQKYEKVEPKGHKSLGEFLASVAATERGEGGFGSTGRNV
ncbi:dUTPase [Lysinibacillus phage vB_LfM_LysYB1]|nr:dUTPase [Lysinibacillus phage vB_LfM_LysYB1]WAB25223.1 dUTPase [Lysinibacillus phage vB_LfM_LysYB2]